MTMCDDLENNIDEIIIPEFITDTIVDIDTRYNEQIYDVKTQNHYDSDSDSEIEDIEQLYETMRYNELINEHLLNIELLYSKLHDYNSIEIIQNSAPTSMEQITKYNVLKLYKRLFYLQEIEPIMLEDEENLREAISILTPT